MYVQPYSSIAQVPDDARFSYLGNFQVATSGIPVTSGAPVIGKLYVSYDVVLRKPQIASAPGSILSFTQHFRTTNTNAVFTPPVNVSMFPPTATPFVVSPSSGSPTTGQIQLTASNAVIPGQYLVWINMYGPAGVSSSNPVAPQVTSGNGGTIALNQSTNSANAQSCGGGTASAISAYPSSYSVSAIISFTPSNTTAFWVFPVPTSGSTTIADYFDIYITALPTGFTNPRRRARDLRQIEIEESANRLDAVENRLGELRKALDMLQELKDYHSMSSVVQESDYISLAKSEK